MHEFRLYNYLYIFFNKNSQKGQAQAEHIKKVK